MEWKKSIIISLLLLASVNAAASDWFEIEKVGDLVISIDKASIAELDVENYRSVATQFILGSKVQSKGLQFDETRDMVVLNCVTNESGIYARIYMLNDKVVSAKIPDESLTATNIKKLNFKNVQYTPFEKIYNLVCKGELK